jgi:hypothetical protein
MYQSLYSVCDAIVDTSRCKCAILSCKQTDATAAHTPACVPASADSRPISLGLSCAAREALWQQKRRRSSISGIASPCMLPQPPPCSPATSLATSARGASPAGVSLAREQSSFFSDCSAVSCGDSTSSSRCAAAAAAEAASTVDHARNSILLSVELGSAWSTVVSPMQSASKQQQQQQQRSGIDLGAWTGVQSPCCGSPCGSAYDYSSSYSTSDSSSFDSSSVDSSNATAATAAAAAAVRAAQYAESTAVARRLDTAFSGFETVLGVENYAF